MAFACQINRGFDFGKNTLTRPTLGLRPKTVRQTNVGSMSSQVGIDRMCYSGLTQDKVDGMLAKHFEDQNILETLSSEDFAKQGYAQCPGLLPPNMYDVIGDDLGRAFNKVGSEKDKWILGTQSRRYYKRIPYQILLSHIEFLRYLHSSPILLNALASIVKSSNIRSAQDGVARCMSDKNHVQGWHTDNVDYAFVTIWEEKNTTDSSRVSVLRPPEDAPKLPAGLYAARYPDRIRSFIPSEHYLLNTRLPHCVNGSKKHRSNVSLFFNEGSNTDRQ